jgi:hypothetical protein
MRNLAFKASVLVIALAATGVVFAGNTQTGNGAPSGAHYNLNIIGVPQAKTADMNGSNGHVIFVPLQGKTTILLTEGPFEVLDANGTDQNGAAFQLPAADADCDGNSDYSVFVRGLGAPGGKATIQTCFVDKATGELLCQAGGEVTVVERTSGKQLFRNETKKLLTVVYDADGDGDLDRTPLFGDDNYGYAWDYTNTGLRLAQMRFYDEFTTLLNDAQYDYNCTISE